MGVSAFLQSYDTHGDKILYPADFQTVLDRVPAGYEVVIHCGGNS